ncbi:hypothetical protein OCU04_012676 [Sclerotinia nivalis]|uniref:Uncharacterized protein n=1 Tax=Sclerotinia nivalis TaxID=352851 RepID=A0A9X0DF44_9HELO|nr:hypothetical protein OCU04_012676 [Sclerotinia nivalis]
MNQGSTALSLKMIILSFKRKLAPTVTIAKLAVLHEYRSVLAQASFGRTDPVKWHRDWTTSYTKALAYRIIEVQDEIATIAFLQVIGTRMLPI